MVDLPDVTLICVSSVKLEETLYAFRKSMQGINFGDVKLITDQDRPDFEQHGITVEKSPKITSIDEYSHYMIYDLHKHIDTTCLLYTSPSPRDAHESRMPSSA